jgi:hypothetical protein
MMTARTIADREAELAAGLPRPAPQQEAPRPAPRQMPAEQDKAEKRPVRISMKASRDIAHDLEMARMAGKIPPVTALRAMIALWQGDPELRARGSKPAKTLR